MTEQEMVLNRFLIDLFDDILRLEEKSISDSTFKDLSLSELHVLEAVQLLGGEGMNAVAATLMITAGTLTTAVKALEQKGYIVRERSKTDKRMVILTLAERAEKALEKHSIFHKNLVSGIMENFSESDTEALCEMLGRLRSFMKSL